MLTDSTGYWFGFDDVFTGLVDELIVLGLLVLAVAIGVPGAQDALDSLENVFSDIKDKIREKKRELQVTIGLTIASVVERSNNGTYAIQFNDGSYYIGKGSPIRMYTSAKIRGARHGTFPTSFRFEWAESDRAAFKKEYMWMVDYGYYRGHPDFYNKIWSPGRIFYGKTIVSVFILVIIGEGRYI